MQKDAMTPFSDDGLHERRESMTNILASWDLDGALPDVAALDLIREYVAGMFGLDKLIQIMTNFPLYPEHAG